MVGVGRPTGGCGSTDSGFREPVLCCTQPPKCPCQCGRQQAHMCADASRTDREARGSAHGRGLARQTAYLTCTKLKYMRARQDERHFMNMRARRTKQKASEERRQQTRVSVAVDFIGGIEALASCAHPAHCSNPCRVPGTALALMSKTRWTIPYFFGHLWFWLFVQNICTLLNF